MSPQILHIFGPLYIQWYGVMIVLALLIFMWRAQKSDLCKQLFSKDKFSTLIIRSIFVAFIGGKLLHIISAYHEYTTWYEALFFWEGGLSILGSVLALLLYVPYFLYQNKIPLGLACDFLAIYAPLLQAIARIGCFFAGCCYGAPALVPWAVVYTDPIGAAPCHVPLHPTQLYSAVLLWTIFLVLRFVLYPILRRKKMLGIGIIVCAYLMGISAERFVIDFWRADRVINSTSALVNTTVLSLHQWIALAIFGASVLGMIGVYTLRRAQGERAKRS